ncbi:uncharacterized protein N7483_006276 [Penicillium malachiteum]|uniref:uncharacterized protein n=1 Tax=Penicillium malachiteum TaxID=1324776 RepID=UPI002548DD50|nr:uncharacterized protein N7483_006276 [Penicillium malachiteum]KAJ5731768.1 hypothetical protein N7483_006276 [Penicillium malachiteum]
MSHLLEHIDACVPVTALKAFPWGQHHFILQGQGPFLRVIDDESGNVRTQLNVFKRNNIHGFIPLTSRWDEGEHTCVRILVWGGQSLREVDLRLDKNDRVISSLSSAEFHAPDWIMSGCAAVKDASVEAYLITANNALLTIRLKQIESPRYQTQIQVHQLATSVKSILCAADLIAFSATHVLIAAGTIFGEIIVWSCFTDPNQNTEAAHAIGSIHHFFTGHDGTVFGVRISPPLPSLCGGQPGRLLASCSDDRTLRIWDISDCENKSSLDPSAYSTDGFDLRSTGFGSTSGENNETESKWCVAKAFGHAARIWDILFRPRSMSSSGIGLVTRSEDATCIAWDLSWQSSTSSPETYKLSQRESSRGHVGKHLWSMDLRCHGDQTWVYTGGADGALKRFKINEINTSTADLAQIKGEPQPKLNEVMHFAFLTPNCLIASDKENKLQVGSVSSGETAIVTWESLNNDSDFGPIQRIAGIPAEGLALISNGQGHVRLYNHRTKSVSDLVKLHERPLAFFIVSSPSANSHHTISFVASYAKDEIATLVMVSDWNSDLAQVKSISITLPQSPFGLSSASLIHSDNYLVLGSRLGGLSVHRVGNSNIPTEALIVERRVHGRDGTNHIRAISSVKDADGSDLEYIQTCGRDGKICIHEINLGRHSNHSISLRTIHRTESGLGGNITGSYIDEETDDLMVYGFRSQDFVLYNESKHSDVIAVSSGGSRRNWAFHPCTSGEAGGLLFWKDRQGLNSRRLLGDKNCLLRAGVHGREIKSSAYLDSIQGSPPIFATGAEDTAVRIFSLSDSTSSSPWGAFKTLRVLNTHRSGLQHVSWSKNGKFLFTSSAEEEFFVWRVQWWLLLPKGDPDSELRITSFDMIEVEESGHGCGFILGLTLSNSTVKVFHYSPNKDNSFSLLAEWRYMENCLTQVRFLPHGSCVTLLTAATDGYLTFWDLTATLQPFYTIDSSRLKSKQYSVQQPPAFGITCEDRYQIHSNSIKAMECVTISPGVTLVLAGGDDNSLSISLLNHSQISASDPHIEVSTKSIPDAHTASVTAIQVLNQPSARVHPAGSHSVNLTFASSGNDHQVKIWRLILDRSQSDSPIIQVQLLEDKYSSVADIASFSLVRGNASHSHDDSLQLVKSREMKLLVCGVGIELFKLNFGRFGDSDINHVDLMEGLHI